jgi:hypothetical protein
MVEAYEYILLKAYISLRELFWLLRAYCDKEKKIKINFAVDHSTPPIHSISLSSTDARLATTLIGLTFRFH